MPFIEPRSSLREPPPAEEESPTPPQEASITFEPSLIAK